jgi:hypothetical protein
MDSILIGASVHNPLSDGADESLVILCVAYNEMTTMLGKSPSFRNFESSYAVTDYIVGSYTYTVPSSTPYRSPSSHQHTALHASSASSPTPISLRLLTLPLGTNTQDRVQAAKS